MSITLNLHSNVTEYKSEKKISKFISTISSLDIIKTLCAENRLVTGLKERRAKIKQDFNIEAYKTIVYPKLGITSYTAHEAIEKKQTAALQYAQILKKYRPLNSGHLTQFFDYLELVTVIESVFNEHMINCGDLLYTGIMIKANGHEYFAKLTAGKPYIVMPYGKILGEGTTGVVESVYEIANQQFFALKHAHLDDEHEAEFDILNEIAQLKKIHHILSTHKTKLDGFQGPVLAEFNLPEHLLVGYLSTQYDLSLDDWAKSDSLSLHARILMCQSLMQICLYMNQFNLWHGDLKPDNIMIKNNQPYVIDWTGVRTFNKAAAKFICPKFQTRDFLNKIDVSRLRHMMNYKDPELVENFTNAAKSLELFSIAMTLYWILTGKMPFDNIYDSDLDLLVPYTASGYKKLPLEKYHQDVTNLIGKMLAHHPDNRYKIEEAYAEWQRIDAKTGKVRSKTYKLV